jgi:hypothetical protein
VAPDCIGITSRFASDYAEPAEKISLPVCRQPRPGPEPKRQVLPIKDRALPRSAGPVCYTGRAKRGRSAHCIVQGARLTGSTSKTRTRRPSPARRRRIAREAPTMAKAVVPALLFTAVRGRRPIYVAATDRDGRPICAASGACANGRSAYEPLPALTENITQGIN